MECDVKSLCELSRCGFERDAENCIHRQTIKPKAAETKVYVVRDGSFDFFLYKRLGNYAMIREEAEENGEVYSLVGFQDAINSGEISLAGKCILIR